MQGDGEPSYWDRINKAHYAWTRPTDPLGQAEWDAANAGGGGGGGALLGLVAIGVVVMAVVGVIAGILHDRHVQETLISIIALLLLASGVSFAALRFAPAPHDVPARSLARPALVANGLFAILYGGVFAFMRDTHLPRGGSPWLEPALLTGVGVAVAVPVLIAAMVFRRRAGFVCALAWSAMTQAVLFLATTIVLILLQTQFGVRIFS